MTNNKNIPDEGLVIDIAIDDKAWETALPDVEAIAIRAINATWELVGKSIGKKANTEVSLALVNDERQQTMNRDYRDQDKPTNVLSFPVGPDDTLAPGAPRLLGDISIALETTENEARTQKKPLANHFCHLAVHGMLHLAGFDHENDLDATKMEKLEIDILNGLGIDNPYT